MRQQRQLPVSRSQKPGRASGATLMEFALLASLASVVCIIAVLALLKN